jgi:hypothetical protein
VYGDKHGIGCRVTLRFEIYSATSIVASIATDTGDLSVFSLSRWQLKKVLGNISTNLAGLYRSQPEERVQSTLLGTQWSYSEWAFFYAAKPLVAHQISDTELVHLVRTANGDFRDFLLAIAVKTDAETRKAVFLSPEDFHKVLKAIAEVVLERVPVEFKADNWIGSRFTAGANAFLLLHMAQ